MATYYSKTSLAIRLLALSISLSTVTLPVISLPAMAAANNQQAAILNNDGVKALNTGNFELAIQKFEEALKIEPGYKFAVENLSIAYNNFALKQSPQQSLKYFHKALALNPNNSTTQQNLDNLLISLNKNPKSFKDRIDLAKQARLSGDFDGAIAEYSSALRCQNDAKTHLDLGNVYRVRDRLDEAINEYKAALSSGGLDRASMAEANKNLGESYQAKKDIMSAIGCYQAAAKADPSNRDIIDALIAGWEEALNENAKSADNHIGLGQAYQLKGDFGMAKAEYEQALVWDRNSQAARTLLAKLPDAQRGFEITKHINAGVDLQLRKQYDAAIAEYTQAAKMDPNNQELWIDLGSALQAKEDFDRAIKAYQRALSIKPSDEAQKGMKFCQDALEGKQMDDLLKTASDLYKQGRYQDALDAYRRVAQKTPNDAGVHFNIGASLQQLNDLDGAIAEYKQSVSLDGKNDQYKKYLEDALDKKAQPIIDQAVAAHKEKQYANAINLYQQALSLRPKRAELHYDLASAFYSQQQYDQARNEYQKALDIDRKGQINDLYFMGTIDENYGKGYDAMDKYRKYIAEAPGGAFTKQAQERLEALTHDPGATQKIKSETELAQIKQAADACQAAVKLQGDKQYDQAIPLYLQAIQLQPKEASYPYGLATLYMQKGDIDSGLRYFDQAIALDPNNKDYKKYKDLALEQKAEQLVNQAVEKQQAEDFNGAISLYTQASKLAPKTARIWTNLASAVYSTDDFNGARNAYGKALELDPKGESVNWYSVAAIDENFGRGSQALDEYRKFITYNPTDKLADAAKQRIAALMKNPADTKKLPTRSEVKMAQGAQEAYDQGVKLQEGGNLDGALELYQKAHAINPKESAYDFAMGSVYQAKNDLANARKFYQAALDLDPKNEQYRKYAEGVKTAEAGPIVDQAAQKFSAQDYPGAIALYRQALQIIPNDAAIHTDLASALQANDDFSNALTEYKKAYELDPKTQVETLYFIGALEENANDGAHALQHFRDYTAKNPRGKFLDYAKQRMAALSKNPADVQKMQTRQERETSAALGGIFDEAVKLQQEGKYDEADAKYNDLTLRSKDPQYAYARGTNFQAKGDIASSIEWYKKAVAGEPSNADYQKALKAVTEGQVTALIDEGTQKYNNKDYNGALETYRKAAAVAPRNAKVHTDMGATYQAMDNFQAARDEYQKGFDTDNRGEVDNLYFMGVLDETLGKGKQALADYTKYLQYAPKGTYAQQANARYQVLYFDPTKIQKMQTQADQQAATAANDAYNEAVKLQQDGKLDAAITKYQEALKANDKSDSIWYSLGTAYQGNNQYDKAVECYNKAIQFNPKEPSYKKVLNDLKSAMASPLVDSAIKKQTTKTDKGDFDLAGAITDYEKALRISDDANTHLNLGTAYQANKNLNKAIEHYTIALRMDPKLHDAHYYLATVYEAQAQPKLAGAEYHKYLLAQPAGQFAPEVKARLKELKL